MKVRQAIRTWSQRICKKCHLHGYLTLYTRVEAHMSFAAMLVLTVFGFLRAVRSSLNPARGYARLGTTMSSSQPNQSRGADLREPCHLQEDLKMISGDDKSFIQRISRGSIIMPNCGCTIPTHLIPLASSISAHWPCRMCISA
jgi:hypothetical protein